MEQSTVSETPLKDPMEQSTVSEAPLKEPVDSKPPMVSKSPDPPTKKGSCQEGSFSDSSFSAIQVKMARGE
ncbi:hypothetical protein TNCV_2502111 [Trichonephila clavipes]|nr:hypothetical protein TNCV_2502111 [Trichonephila clavipes]